MVHERGVDRSGVPSAPSPSGGGLGWAHLDSPRSGVRSAPSPFGGGWGWGRLDVAPSSFRPPSPPPLPEGGGPIRLPFGENGSFGAHLDSPRSGVRSAPSPFGGGLGWGWLDVAPSSFRPPSPPPLPGGGGPIRLPFGENGSFGAHLDSPRSGVRSAPSPSGGGLGWGRLDLAPSSSHTPSPQPPPLRLRSGSTTGGRGSLVDLHLRDLRALRGIAPREAR